MLRWLFALAMGAALAFVPDPAACAPSDATGRPYGIDDLLKMESFGQASLDPTETRLVFERQKAFDAAPVFDHDFYNTVLRSDLYVTDVAHPGTAGRLLATGEGSGHMLGPWSPSGRRLLVYRLRDRVWDVGVIESATGVVQWLGLSPELPGWGRTVQWLSDDELILVVRTDGKSPWRLRAAWEPLDRLTEGWSLTRTGVAPARTMIGSGAFRDRTPMDANTVLVDVDLVSGARRDLARDQIYDIEASPDGRHVAVASFAKDIPVDPGEPFLQGQFPRARTLRIVDIATGRSWAPLNGADLLPNLLSWSQTSEELLVWVREGGGWEDGHLLRANVRRRDIETVDLGDRKPALRETGLRTPVVMAGWLGQQPVVYAQPAGGRADWYALGRATLVSLTSGFQVAPDRLDVVDEDGALVFADGAVWRLTGEGIAYRLSRPGSVAERRPGSLVDLGQRFAFNDTRSGWWPLFEQDGHLWRVDALGQQIPIAIVPSQARVLASGGHAAVWIDTDDHYRQSLVIGTPHDATVVARINEHYGTIAFARRRAVHHVGPSGEPLISWLYLPAEISRTLPPLIVIPYPGASNPTPDVSAEPTISNTAISVPVLTGAGYAVLVPSLPRSAFPNEPVEGLADQVLAVVDAAAPACECDVSQLVLWGHSFGAHAALAIASQTTRFSALVAANGPYDLVSAWGAFAPLGQSVVPENGLTVRSRAGWVETGQGGMGGPPWLETDRYLRNSPMFQVDRISTPVLLITSDLDYIAPGQAEELFSALYRLNKDSVLLRYFGEGHVFASPANIRDMMTTSLDWIHDVLSTAQSQGGNPQSQLRSQDSMSASSMISP